MKSFKITLLLLSAISLFAGCGSDDDDTLPTVEPAASGTFIDERDGYEYHWVRFGGLDWMVENSHYDLGDDTSCKFYVPYEEKNDYYPEDKTSAKYGFLYTHQGALDAVPEGWRLPTDDDYKALEIALGMSKSEADAWGWRGSNQSTLMQQSGEGTRLDFKLAGYFTQHTIMGTSGYRFMASYGFYWTATLDSEKDGDFYIYRKLVYNSGQVFRQSMEPTNQMLSVRFVRDAQ